MSRLNNNAQACINAKRIIVNERVYEKYREMLVREVSENWRVGDPMDERFNIGPLARLDLV